MAPEARQALLWSLSLGLLGFLALVLKRRFLQAIEANERIPPKRWFGKVSRSLARLSRRMLRVEHAVKRLDERQTDHFKRTDSDHARLHNVENDVGRIKVKLEIDGD